MFRLAVRTATRSARLYSTAPAKRSSLKFAALATVGGMLVGGALAMNADAAEPKLLDAKAAGTRDIELLTEDDFEPEPQAAYNPETGEINWDCPCLGGMAHGPCGEEFKKAFSCFVYSTAEPKGMECIEAFQGMQNCFREHPEIYAEQLADDSEPAVVENIDKTGLAVEKKVADVSEEVVTEVTEVKDQIKSKVEDVEAKIESKIESQPITTQVKEVTAKTVSKITPDAKSETWSSESDAHEFKDKLNASIKKTEGQLEHIAEGLSGEAEKFKEKLNRHGHQDNQEAPVEHRSEADEVAKQTASFKEKVAHRIDETADQIRHLGGK